MRKAWVLWVGALALVAGCDRPVMPYAIRSLAVLPPDVSPYHQMAGRLMGESVTQMLTSRTAFRVVGIASTTRLLADGPGQILYQRFRDQAKTTGRVDGTLCEVMARRLGVNGVVLPSLQVSLSHVAGGQVALSLGVFEAGTGERVWSGYRSRPFAGMLGEPGFMGVAAGMADEMVRGMPAPFGEDSF